MKKVSLLVISIVIACVLSNPAQTQSRSNPVLEGMIKALGGDDFTQVKDIHTTGRFFSFSKGDLSGSDLFADYIKFPDMERTEFGRERSKMITINKGAEGWKIEPKNDPEPQPAGQAEDFLSTFKTSFDYVLRFAVRQPQTTIQSLSGEIIDFKRTDVLEVRDPAKNLIRFYVDRDTHLPVKMQVRRANQSRISEELYGNWHKFQGVNTPLLVVRSTDGVKTMEIRAETAVYNSSLSDSLFAPPAGK
jgi:hypothetical protein